MPDLAEHHRTGILAVFLVIIIMVLAGNSADSPDEHSDHDCDTHKTTQDRINEANEEIEKESRSITHHGITGSSTYLPNVKVTAYCPCTKCCGEYADGVTSRGVDANTKGFAVDPKRISYGTLIYIKGYGIYRADDTGGAMRNSKQLHIDVRFPTHQEALNWGVKTMPIVIHNEDR